MFWFETEVPFLLARASPWASPNLSSTIDVLILPTHIFTQILQGAPGLNKIRDKGDGKHPQIEKVT
jgi:hypothetical protein